MSGDKLTLQKILPLGYAAYERHHAIPAHVRRAVWAILACRTARLGGHVQACLEGHIERVWYNACHPDVSAMYLAADRALAAATEGPAARL